MENPNSFRIFLTLKKGKMKIPRNPFRSRACNSSVLQRWCCHPMSARVLELAWSRSLWISCRKVCLQWRQRWRQSGVEVESFQNSSFQIYHQVFPLAELLKRWVKYFCPTIHVFFKSQAIPERTFSFKIQKLTFCQEVQEEGSNIFLIFG